MVNGSEISDESGRICESEHYGQTGRASEGRIGGSERILEHK